MAEFLALAGQDLAELLQGLDAVDDAGGVVRGVHDHHLGVLRDALFQLVKADLEVLGIGRDDDAGRAGGLRVGGVLGEVRSKKDELRAVHGEGVHHGGHRGSSAAGEEDVLGADLRSGALAEVGCDGFAGLGAAAGGGIAVQGDGIDRLKQLADGICDLGGSRNRGVADGEVKDVFLADDFGLGHAVLKKHADAALGDAHLMELFYYHILTSFRENDIRLPAPGRSGCADRPGPERPSRSPLP